MVRIMEMMLVSVPRITSGEMAVVCLVCCLVAVQLCFMPLEMDSYQILVGALRDSYGV